MDVNLLLVKKDGSVKTFPMPSSVTVMGRRKDCDLRIPLDSISRKHCRLTTQDNGVKIRDLNSRNGTVINGKTIEEKDITAGDKLSLGPLTFVFQLDGKPDKFEIVDTDADDTASDLPVLEVDDLLSDDSGDESDLL